LEATSESASRLSNDIDLIIARRNGHRELAAGVGLPHEAFLRGCDRVLDRRPSAALCDRAGNCSPRRCHAIGVYFETENARIPVEAGRRRINVFKRAPESALVSRVDKQGAVIAPAILCSGLHPADHGGYRERIHFALRQRINRVAG
jgi:hypothetical protein